MSHFFFAYTGLKFDIYKEFRIKQFGYQKGYNIALFFHLLWTKFRYLHKIYIKQFGYQKGYNSIFLYFVFPFLLILKVVQQGFYRTPFTSVAILCLS